MIGLQGLHSNNVFQYLNVAASVGLKWFCSWCFNFGGNTEAIATHLREVHYRLAITCDICQSFTIMPGQVVLEHQSRCRSKSHMRSRQRSRTKPPKASINESCKVVRCLSISIWSCQWMWIFPVILAKWVCIQPYKLSYFQLMCLQCQVSCNLLTVL